MNDDGADGRSKPDPIAAARLAVVELPKRFYRAASIVHDDGVYGIHLDGRRTRTPGKRVLTLPTRPLAEAVAAEWQAQADRIDPRTMPLTRLANSTLDGVETREDDVRADIVKYCGSDLLCYRAEGPGTLVARQAEVWDPVLTWARDLLGAQFRVGTGIVHMSQSDEALQRVAQSLAGLDAWRLAPLHVMTTLLGSALLALAHGNGFLSADAAWIAGHVDEDWQAEQWGLDAEALARRKARQADFVAASCMLALVNRP